jgi:SPP1 gp7 family putative phage head morphogenesis protein
MTKSQNAIAKKTNRDIDEQLKKYYASTMKRVIADFEATYDKLQATIEDGKEPTPADLYKLDKYWQMQGQLKNELQKLGDKEVVLLSKNFEKEWKAIYETTALPSDVAFSTVSFDDAKAMINTTWLSDGKNFSQRIWGNTEKLAQTLNDMLIECVQTGRSTSDLRELLQNRFNVSYNSAKTLVRTETAHIQTQAAAQRYQDYGLKYYEFLADPDERTCDKCGALDGKKFLYSEMVPGKNAPPMHPNDRCTIIPVIDNESEEKIMENIDIQKCNWCGKEFDAKFSGRRICPDCSHKEWLRRNEKEGMSPENLALLKEGYEKGLSTSEIKLKKHKVKCAGCGKEFRTTNNVGKQYCSKCKKEGKAFWSTREGVKCTECGDYFVRNKKGSNKTMCNKCYEQHRKEYKRKKAQEYRAKNKKN